MSVLDALDATRICARSAVTPDAWTRPVPVAVRRESAAQRAGDYSWRSLLRNPHALLLTGMVSTVLAQEAMVRRLAPLRRESPRVAPLRGHE